ncbi:MAG: L,D-transpeptidase [Actinobacteria bacterium]|nr:L,D-transpeptidase [Actinomycetota bacterium]
MTRNAQCDPNAIARHPSRLDRRALLQLASLAGVAGATLAVASPLRAETETAAAKPAAPAVRQPPTATYTSVSGHHMQGPILSWWLQYGREQLLGWPITEQTKVGDEIRQYFQRGALALRPKSKDPLGVEPVDLGAEWLARQPKELTAPTKVDTRAVWWFWQTPYAVHPTFWPAFRDGGGAFAFGYPASWGITLEGKLAQVFKRAVLVAAEDGIEALPLGFDEATRLKLATTPVNRSAQISEYRSPEFAPDYGPMEFRWAEVDLTKQVTTFYVGEQVVYKAMISSGRHPYYTPVGEWKIWKQTASELMIGGEPGTDDYYRLDHVYYAQYFTQLYAAFHYAYWHDDFGKPTSHGCVNMRLDDSRWAWYFLGIGSHVSVRP